ncbi:hypothetical protein WICPIJ_007416 [Wickerhamomyces pijperi]|uniref:Uncharacterized protein n=1 Tax=Wickerhamomyces pijperi TaxID=599730 RepID=A0A9P8Q072_WICPI|nr:hypothetical protein WICPIJ_007416 [Wickerhamomyces pijperi]
MAVDDLTEGSIEKIESTTTSAAEPSTSTNEPQSDSDTGDFGGLHDIGNFAALKLPSFSWNKQDSATFSKTYQDLIQSRREQLSTLIDDLKEGFSLRSALDRFQTIRTLLESEISQTIDNNVDSSDSEAEEGAEGEQQQEEERNAEPRVVKAAVEPKGVPLLHQVIIPQTKDPERKIHKRRHHSVSDHHSHSHSQDQHIYQTHPELKQLTSIDSHEVNDQSVLRNKIKSIRKLSISDTAKNHMIQKLMMGAHYDKIKFVDSNGEEVLKILNKRASQVTKPSPLEPLQQRTPPSSPIVTDQDRTKTYNDEDQEILGCPHYQRNCKMECPECRRWYGCPICHDEEVSEHKFQRNQTRNILCMECFTPQQPDEFCSQCDLKFASYYCSTCVLYDNDETKDIYHCDDCGICRLGLGLGQDFFHCKGCNACLAIELQNDHRCIERSIESDCPICGEYMFTSIKPVVFMSCGHAIHQSCYDDHSKHSYKCPTCQKTVLNMEAQFRVLDMEIRLQPLPHPYSQWTCVIRCNDCNAKSSTPYHVLGLKCDNCKSYNTAQLKLIKPEQTDANTTTDCESDISTTTNDLRSRAKKTRDLKHIAINSSNLLNKNFNKEHLTEAEEEAEHREDTDAAAAAADGAEADENENENENENVLTLPRQFMSNFDQYITNLQEYFSSSDEEDHENSGDDVDFLHVNKTFAKFQQNMTNNNNINDSNDNNNTAPQHDNTNADNGQAQLTNSNRFVNNITTAFNNFLTSIDQTQQGHNHSDDYDEDMGNETDDEMELDSDNGDVPLIEEM